MLVSTQLRVLTLELYGVSDWQTVSLPASDLDPEEDSLPEDIMAQVSLAYTNGT